MQINLVSLGSPAFQIHQRRREHVVLPSPGQVNQAVSVLDLSAGVDFEFVENNIVELIGRSEHDNSAEYSEDKSVLLSGNGHMLSEIVVTQPCPADIIVLLSFFLPLLKTN